jgi:hypothetical protein
MEEMIHIPRLVISLIKSNHRDFEKVPNSGLPCSAPSLSVAGDSGDHEDQRG